MSKTSLPRFVPKAWGHEEILVAEPFYTLKRLTVLPGFQCSLHYHRQKVETFLIISGAMRLERVLVARSGECSIKASDMVYTPGNQVHVPNYTAHRFRCATNEPCVFWEVSTYDDEADTVRLEPSGPVG